MAANKFTGVNLLVSVGGVVIEPKEVKSFTITDTQDTSESTGATDTDKTFHSTLRDHTFAGDFWSTSSGSTSGSASAYWALHNAQTAGSTGTAFIVYPNGNTSGQRTVTFNGFVTSIDEGVTYNEVVPLTVSGQITGVVTRATV